MSDLEHADRVGVLLEILRTQSTMSTWRDRKTASSVKQNRNALAVVHTLCSETLN